MESQLITRRSGNEEKFVIQEAQRWTNSRVLKKSEGECLNQGQSVPSVKRLVQAFL